MDTLASGCNLQTVEQQVEALCVSLILRVVHRIERSLFRRIFGDKYEVCIVLLFEILADQKLLLRLKVERVADLSVVFLGYQLFRFRERYSWDFFCL